MSNNIRRLLFCGCLLSGLCLLGILFSFAQGENLILNGDMEEGNLYWNITDYGSRNFYVKELPCSHSGDYTAHAILCSYYTWMYFSQVITGLVPSSAYEISWWQADSTQDAFGVCSTGCTDGPCNAGNPSLAPMHLAGWDPGWAEGGAFTVTNSVTDTWEHFGPYPLSTNITGELLIYFYVDGSNCAHYLLDDVYVSGIVPPPTPGPGAGGNICNLENYSFNDGIADWTYGDWVIEGPGFVELHGNVDTLSSWIAQPISLTATGPSDNYQLSIMARSPFPVSPDDAPFVRWKLDSLISGTTPFWFQDQAKITSWGAWQFNSWVLRDSNSPAISDTLEIWAYGGDIQIDNVCITFQQGPASSTPICPPEPTYTPNPTYTPLPTPTAVNSATATAWAATATAWPIQTPYPTLAPPNCATGGDQEPDFSFIWLMGQVIMLLGAFFEAIFRLLGTVLQPIFDLIGFVVWLLGAAFGLIAQLIDLIRAALQFLISLLEVAFDILGIVGAFFVALWNLLSASPADPGFEIPADWAWPIAAWNFLIEGTPLELLAPVAMGIGSLLMILWTIRQFSSSGES